MLRVHRFAAAIDMIAAGTSAPIPMAAKAIPANQDENCPSKSIGITVLESGRPVAALTIGFVCAAIAA